MASETQKTWRRVWIIGASSGIGEALVRQLCEDGLDVVASARRTEPLDALSQSCSLATSLPLDLSDAGAVSAAVEQMASDDRLPDLTIFCAAIYDPGGLEVLTHQAAQRHMAVNYLGAVATIESLKPHLSRQGAGDIAIISSLTSYCGLPKASLYGPTKAALSSLCETLYPEFEKLGLGLFLVNPGFVETRLTEKNSFSMPFLMTSEQSAKRILTGLEKRRFEIAFPFPMALGLRLLSWVPFKLYFYLMKRMVA